MTQSKSQHDSTVDKWWQECSQWLWCFSANWSKMTVVCPLLHQIPNTRMLQFYMRSNLSMVNIGDLIILIWQYPSFRTEKSVTCFLLYYYICLNWHVLSKFSWGYILTINNEGRAATHQERVLTKSSLVNQWVYYDALQEHEGPKQPYHKEIPSQLYTPYSLAAASLCSARAGRSHTQVRSPHLPTSSTREC